MTYAVTFCATDQEVGSNFFWHGCLLLSVLDKEKKLFEVVDNCGFYGLPTTAGESSWMRALKIKVGLDVDIYGNHGLLCPEEIRFLDRGCGLHGVTFQLSEKKFLKLQNRCRKMVQDQNDAIAEAAAALKLTGKPSGKETRYAYEKHSLAIFEWEKNKAREEGREARLKPFELNLSFGLTGPDSSASHNCKSQIVTLLEGILTPDQIHRLNEGGNHPTIPRRSGPMESIYLHSVGPLKTHVKASGLAVYYRDGKDPNVKLYWTIPPQEFVASSQKTIDAWKVFDNYAEEVKEVVGKLQRLEWALRNAVVDKACSPYQQDLINKVIESYTWFSSMEPKDNRIQVSGLMGGLYSLFSFPRTTYQKALFNKIKEVNVIFQLLYIAIDSEWTFSDFSPPDLNAELKDSEEDRVKENDVPIEIVAAYMSVRDKKQICEILGRTFYEPQAEQTNIEAETSCRAVA